MIKSPTAAANAGNSASLTTPAIVIALVLLLGAIIYLWRARYIRRRSAYVLIAFCVIALTALAFWMLGNPVAGAS